MRRFGLAAVCLAVAACDEAQREATTVPADNFPKAGDYHMIRDVNEGGQQKRVETDIWIDASNRVAFEKLIARGTSNCSDREVEIADGEFSARMTCDAPDGDIHNIGLEAHGTYSKDSIDIFSTTTLWGTPITDTTSYRLKS
jgi:hypothetical protein